jgi:hypothetical protein
MKFEELLPYWPAGAAVGLGLIAGAVAYLWLRKPASPAELERRRRAMLDLVGKMGDGTITEVHGSLLSYTYQVRGIEYQATQDVEVLAIGLLPEQWGTIDAIAVKFDARNPANSLIVSEKWSGLPKNVYIKVNP